MPGHYGSEVLKAIDQKVKPSHCSWLSIDYGGEIYDQTITFGQMLFALAMSMVSIFLILLFQFRKLSEPLVVMSAIPLSLFGRRGLVLTAIHLDSPASWGASPYRESLSGMRLFLSTTSMRDGGRAAAGRSGS